MIDVEVFIIFFVAVFFTFLYFATKDDRNTSYGVIVAFGSMAAASWMILSFLWLFLVNTPVMIGGSIYGTYAVAMLFSGFALLIVTFIILDEFHLARRVKMKEIGDYEE